MSSRLDDLEIRLTHQELAIEQMSSSHIELQRQIDRLRLEIDYLRSVIKELDAPAMMPPGQEPPPPHY